MVHSTLHFLFLPEIFINRITDDSCKMPASQWIAPKNPLSEKSVLINPFHSEVLHSVHCISLKSYEQ